jgi:hypothetical protein
MEDIGSQLAQAGGMLLLLVVLAIGVALILVLREVVCWYWKINKISKCLDEQRETQKTMLGELQTINRNLLSLANHLDGATGPEVPVATDEVREGIAK